MKPQFFKRATLLASLSVMLFSGVTYAGEDLLEPTWVRPDTDWTKYSAFLVKPLDIDDVKVLKPAWSQDDPEEWELKATNAGAIQAIFSKAMADTLQDDGGYPVVGEAADNALEVKVELLSITPWLKPGTGGMIDGHHVTTLGSGEINGRVELRDSETRELLMLIEGERAVGEEYVEFNAENNADNLHAMFSEFATRLRKSMDRVHSD
jgi:hypothetical protein